MRLNKFFTSASIYNERLEICKTCPKYFKPTGTCLSCGCFVRVKSKISSMSCPDKKWMKTTTIETPTELDKDLIAAVIEIHPLFKDKRPENYEQKIRIIELYNTIHGTNYSNQTSCGSCLHSIWKGLNDIYQKHKDE